MIFCRGKKFRFPNCKNATALDGAAVHCAKVLRIALAAMFAKSRPQRVPMAVFTRLEVLADLGSIVTPGEANQISRC